MDTLRKIRHGHLSCVPFWSAIDVAMGIIYKIMVLLGTGLGGASRCEERGMAGDVGDVSTKSGHGSVPPGLAFLSLFLVGGVAYAASGYLLSLFHYSVRGPRVFMYGVFIAGFAARFGEARLDRAEAVFGAGKSLVGRCLFGASGAVSLGAAYYVLKHPDIMSLGDEVLRGSASGGRATVLWFLIAGFLYAGFFRPLACSVWVTFAYYAGSEDSRGYVLNPLNTLILVMVPMLYVVSMGGVGVGAFFFGKASVFASVTWAELAGWVVFWGAVVASAGAVGVLLLSAAGLVRTTISYAVEVGLLAYVMSQCMYGAIYLFFDIRGMVDMTRVLLAVPVVSVCETALFWGLVFAGVVVPVRFWRQGIRYAPEGVVMHLYFSGILGLVFNVPAHSVVVARYVGAVSGLFGWVPSAF